MDTKRFIPWQMMLIAVLLIFMMLLVLFVSAFTKPKADNNIPVFERKEITVIIDAGHGGEDGGTSDKKGTLEKDLNLIIAKELEALFNSSGINTVLTRSEDKLLYDPNENYKGRKKILDMRERVRIVSEYENAVLISIHMNSFPEEKYKGIQVYYSDNSSESIELAENIQSNVCTFIQKDNTRKIKCGKDIFLLDRVNAPAVLVECGFLSNPEEAEMLSCSEYRNDLAFFIFYSACALIE